jgi:hypothetical protein
MWCGGWICCGRLHCVEIGGAICCKTKCIRKKEKWGEGRGGSSGHKLNITDRIISSVTSLVILLVKISRHRMICFFFNLTVIPSVYTEKSFPLAYYGCTLPSGYVFGNVICKSYISSYCLVFFPFFIFPLQFPRYIPIEFLCWCLLMDT